MGGGRAFTFDVCPDTGTTQTIVSADIARRFNLPVDTGGREFLTTASHMPMDCIGSVVLRATLKGVKVTLFALVSRDLTDEILVSCHDLIELKVIPKDFPNVQCRQINAHYEGESGD